MANEYGIFAKTAMAFEGSYGVVPAAGTYIQPLYTTNSIGKEQSLIFANLAGQGRKVSEPFKDATTVSGDIVVPVDLRYIGFWFRALLGDPVTTPDGSGNFTHVFISEKNLLPSFTLEKHFPNIPVYTSINGAKVNSMAFDFQRTGQVLTTVNVLAQGEDVIVAPVDPNPIVLEERFFSAFNGGINEGGTPLARVLSGNFTFSNGLLPVETIRSDGKVDSIDEGLPSLTGEIVVRFSDRVLLDKATAGLPIAVDFEYKIDDVRKLTMTAHRLFLPVPNLEVSGEGGIDLTFAFQGATDPNLTKMFTVTLTNDVASYA
ncbi:phage tail tube protein [Rickettsia endosymbiont of Cardiosporidium cionae]|uniref:phage tail tube protein n=1 Tax=Rickettsia endosymbiont of Cardiosporidium cionae TaxID=2777155 RepID=UPI0018948461|nr:phage tail tube protein [Rickettsia endosymbiont of Cardiosporidium cionae]KAF8818078.1 hypothetical protein IHI24_000877 [Rickettsia endosymbiont of Cardiosporidium cionae]